MVVKLCISTKASNSNRNFLFSGFVEQVYIEMFSLNSEITRDTSSSSYDI